MAKEGFTQGSLKKAYPSLFDSMMETKGERAPEGCYNTYVNFFREYTTASGERRKVSLQSIIDYLEKSGYSVKITAK
jgi:hypothetical protein